VKVFVPGRMREAIADRRSEFEARGVGLVLAGDGSTMRLLENKGQFFQQVPPGIAVHESHRVKNWTEFEAALQALGTRRACFKPAVGTFGLGFYVLDDRMTPLKRLLRSEAHRISKSELHGILAGLDTFPELLVMEYLAGDEFSVDVLAHQGAVLAQICRRKPKSAPSRMVSGIALTPDYAAQMMEHRDDIAGMVKQLVSHFDLGGLLNVQFRLRGDQAGRPLLLEINGRMSGGLPYTGLSGLNLPLLAVRIALLRKGEPLPTIPAPTLPLRVQERSEVFVNQIQ
jgi:hypothetical protein